MTLYGIHELAKAAGVKPRTLAAYLARGKCPTPTARLAAGPVWTHEDVAAWLQTRDERLERAHRGRPQGLRPGRVRSDVGLVGLGDLATAASRLECLERGREAAAERPHCEGVLYA